jgi:hypothetical protein
MKLLRFEYKNTIHAGILTGGGVVPVEEINARTGTRVPNDVLSIIRQNAIAGLDGIAELDSIPNVTFEEPSYKNWK